MIIYKTTNLINNKIYIGQKPSVSLEEDFLNSDYYGSGKKIIEAIKEFGKENFKREVLEHCDSIELLDSREAYWIEFFEATNQEKGYNISRRSGRHFFTGCRQTDEAKKKISEAGKNRKHSEESKKKMSESQKGKKTSDETKRKMSELKKGSIPWNKGMKMSDEFRQKVIDNRKTWPISEKIIKPKNISNQKRSKSHVDYWNNMTEEQYNIRKKTINKKSAYDCWLEKYGKEEADKRKAEWIAKLKQARKRNEDLKCK